MRGACRHLNNVINDVKDEVLTLQELRTKMKEVERDMSSVPKAREVARRALAAVTRDDPASFAKHVEELAGICLGYVR